MEQEAATVVMNGPAIALCLSGTARLEGAQGAIDLRAGEAVFATPDEHTLRIAGACDLVVAATGAPDGRAAAAHPAGDAG